MRLILTTLYSVFATIFVLALLYLVSPYVVEHPKKSLAILAILMLTYFGTGLRSAVEILIILPMIKIVKDKTSSLVLCPIVFIIGLLVAVVIPWINGVEGWSGWNWFASITFTLFNLETFLAIINGIVAAYNNG